MSEYISKFFRSSSPLPQQNTNIVIRDGEIDVETVERDVILKIIPHSRADLESVFEWRRINLKITPDAAPYLALGCILLDDLIQNKKSLFQKRVPQALKYLTNREAVKQNFRRAFETAVGEFEKLVEEIRLEREYRESVEESQLVAIQATSFQTYNGLNQGKNAKTLILSVQALLLRFIMENSISNVDKGFLQCVRNTLYFLDSKYLRIACLMFAAICSYKISFFDYTSSDKNPYKAEFYSDPKTKEFSAQAFVLSIPETKGSTMIAIGYPVTDSMAGYKLQGNYLSEKGSMNGKKEIKIKIEPKEEALSEDIEDVQSVSSDFSIDEDYLQMKQKMEEEKTLEMCDMCKASLNLSYLFYNRYCKHNICVDCLNDLGLRSKGFCPVGPCTSRMSFTEMSEFLKRFQKRKAREEEPKKTKILLKENSYDSHGNRSDKSFVNGAQVLSRKPSLKDQPKAISKNGNSAFKPVNSNHEKSALGQLLGRCYNCSQRKEETQLFMNLCGHRFCISCLQNKSMLKSASCPVRECPHPFDYEGMNLFMDPLVAKEEELEFTSEKLTCQNCQETKEFEFQKSTKPVYYKCENCRVVSCIKHKNVMSKCQCYCEKCLTEIEYSAKTLVKWCKTCHKGVCTMCGEEKTSKELCKCVCAICFDNNPDPHNRICQPCSTHGKYCQICMDILDEMNEYLLECGHRICITCNRINLSASQSKPYACKTCSLIN